MSYFGGSDSDCYDEDTYDVSDGDHSYGYDEYVQEDNIFESDNSVNIYDEDGFYNDSGRDDSDFEADNIFYNDDNDNDDDDDNDGNDDAEDDHESQDSICYEGNEDTDDDDNDIDYGDLDFNADADDDDDDEDDDDGDDGLSEQFSRKYKKQLAQNDKNIEKSGSRKRKRKPNKKSRRPSKNQAGQSNTKVSRANKEKSKNPETSSAKKNPLKKKKRKDRPSVNINPGAIRTFSEHFVKISKSGTTWARKMTNTHIESIRKYCKAEAAGMFSHFEYTGSFYEHLKTGGADELDILVALNTKDNAHLTDEELVDVVPGYARIRVNNKASKYNSYAEDAGNGKRYVSPAKIKRWFFSIVQKAINKYDSQNKKDDAPELKLVDNGPATTLVIDDKKAGKKLHVDLVPAFLFKPKKNIQTARPVEARRYVAKSFPEELPEPNGLKFPREMLWRKSFSLQEKKKMEKMDKKDNGCRREVFKVVKAIVKGDPTLAKLSSYHVKTAFLHYNFDKGQEDMKWTKEHLADRFLGLMKYLSHKISQKNLSHFFIRKLNLLEELNDSALDNIENRLSKLISNENELKRVLREKDALSKDKPKRISRRKRKRRKLQ